MLLLALLLLAQPAPDSLDTAAPDSTAAAGDSAADVIYYGGKRAIFLARTEEVVLLDSAWVRYRDMSVYSDSIHYDVRKRLLGAHRAVDFHTASERIAGAQLFYNVDTRRGLIRSARTQVENGFFVAAEAWLVKERVLNARRAAYTTCDREHPHYAFYGPRVKLLMDDVAIAEPVVLRIGRVPVLAAPFWLVPVASKRKSGLMAFKVGNSTDQGYYAKDVSYYWVINDYSDATFYLDIMTRKGIQLRGEGVYIVKPFARGSVQGSYIREWDTRRLRYGFNAAHSSRFFFDTELDAQADFLSDTSYAPDYGEEPLTWLKQDLLSYASLSRRFRGVGRASARVESRSDLIRHTRDLHLPVASFAFSPLRLGGDWDATPSLSFSRRLSSADSAGIDTARTERRSGSAGFGLTGPDWGLGRLQLSDAAGYGEVLRWRREG
ncbi:LPS-assembly protein LptD, partial [candidate division WOR-3 bacterium]|nr:LPS-assembly protein LptD [candidate division WOR-3 bacterium]